MFLYYLSHVVQIWIFPPGLNIFLALIGIILDGYQLAIGKYLIGLSLLLLWLFSTPIIADYLIASLITRYPPLNVKQAALQNNQSAAVIILGGGHAKAPEFDYHLALNRYTLFRVRYAVHLHQELQIPIIASGGKLDKESISEAEVINHELKTYFKVFPQWSEKKSITTRDEALHLLPILRKHHIDTAYIVTDSWHMPRAMYAFNRAFNNTGIKIIAAPVGFPSDADKSFLEKYFPTGPALVTSAGALHEYVGLVAYHVFNFFRLKPNQVRN